MNARNNLFERLMAELGPAVARVAASFSRQQAEREDLEQDIWLAVWRALPSFRGDASLRTFVLRIAHNRAVSSLAMRRYNVPLDETAELVSNELHPETDAARNEQAAMLLAAVEKLPLGWRQAIMLRLEGLSLAEVADALGITENNATVRVNRARKRLSELLEQNNAKGRPESVGRASGSLARGTGSAAGT